ncbi:MAG: arylesterase [Terrimicrobiaceae bacterium]
MKSYVLLAASLGLASCTPVDPVAPGRIVFLGDSLTEGYGLSPEESYPALLSDRLAGHRLTVVNAGISGETTAGGLGRVGAVVGPDTRVLVLALGANDVLARGDPAAMKSNLLAMIAEARAANPQVRILLAGIRFTFPVDNGTYSQVYAEVAREAGVAHLPHLLSGVIGNPQLNQPDGMHPTAEGQKMMAETVWEALEPLL